MQDALSSGIYDRLINDNEKRLVHLYVDGVACEERIGLDVSRLPHQFVGLCLHNPESQFISEDDVLHVERDLDRECEDITKVHYAKEVNDKDFTSLVPVALVPTCKKDHKVGESTQTVKEITQTIYDAYHKLNMHNTIGPLSINSDGAGQFRKGMGQILGARIPSDIGEICLEGCPLFNIVGGEFGMTISCDIDHLGKRFRARVKTACGVLVGVVALTRTDLAQLLAYSLVITNVSAAERLFDPEDNMDVSKMVQCLDAIGRLADVPWLNFPPVWRNATGNCTIYYGMKIIGSVTSAMCAMITGCEGRADEEGDHISGSE